MAVGTYETIATISTGVFKDKGSRFLAFAYPVSSVEEVKETLKTLRREHHAANHYCYAYQLGANQDVTYKSSDSGEPAGTAGKPILSQIQCRSLTNTLVVVVRYFGGRLLGKSGLTNAYRSAVADALNNAEITSRMVVEKYELSFPYQAISEVIQIIKEANLECLKQEFGLLCTITLVIGKDEAETIVRKLGSIEGLAIKKSPT